MWYCFSIEHAVKVGKHDVISIVQDKHAILADATQDVRKWDAHVLPQHIVAERSGKSQADTHEHYQQVFAKFEPLSIQTSTKMVTQFHPWYLGMSHPFTLAWPWVFRVINLNDLVKWKQADFKIIWTPPLSL